ncbi:MAG: sulfite exporter TauE/SafE family protein [Lentisphaerae bacterium]|nr:sulfite exporter TauE/SafE family protein [Lentisphaerota bacterium]MBT4818679.1 sulfite exporter TauE/SafE family protein [Lentisphaerota bacterium]MBT5611800.1 sulfite exporter TauE/SafE family protein [Lentisphaerota bacterium]MBT7057339.1 sulfite exporter TauE/SafE family protein [Lentisphaerota bacterium]MBT7845846.1 sulfite exporter TauE/SafE family protein [Lentisphaerota bacterium]
MEFNLLFLLLYALWGLVVGLMVGFTAIGKGILGTPGLIIFFHLDPVIAVGSMGFAGVVMMLASVVQHWKEKNIEWRIAGIFSVTAIPASYFAAYYADAINAVLPLKFIIGIIILVSTVLLFYRYVIMKPKPRELEVPRWKLVAAPFLGLVLGALMGATSISGSIIVIIFLLVLKLPSPISVGTTSAVAAVSLAVAAVAHISEGHMDWQAVIGLIPGVIIGSTIGSRYVNKVPRQLLRYTILVILVIAGVIVVVKG